jgi:C4-dicarboxylate-specific signal transduction histidine kinase
MIPAVFSRQPIRRQLIAAALVLLLPMLSAMAWLANRTRHERRDEVRDEAVSIAAMAAAQLEQYFVAVDAVAYAVSRHPALISQERDDFDRFVGDFLRKQPFVTNVVLTSPEGLVLAAAFPPLRDVGQVAPAAAVGITQVVRTRQPYMGNLETSPVTGRPVVLLGYPVQNEHDAVVAVLGFALDLDRLQTAFADIPLPDGSVITIVDRQNRVIARSRDADRFVGSPAWTGFGKSGGLRTASLQVDLDGVERFTAEVGVRGGAWTLSVGIPRSVVRERLQPLWGRNLSFVATAVFTLMCLAFLIAWQTSLHLNRLRGAAQRMAGGDLSPLNRAPTPNLEFAKLQDTFIDLAANLRDARDALDRRMAQERQMNETLHSLQRQVVRQERLAAVGLLVSGVAHEVNNPLQAILGTAELVERRSDVAADIAEEIGFLKTQASRASEIIRNLARFTSQQSGPPALVDLCDVVGEVVRLRGRDLEAAGILLETQGTTTGHVYANFTELEQVTLNFVINAQQAIEASRAHGRILIRLLEVEHRVRLEVVDDGPGVRPEDEPKLFQPFFTTKPVGKGTGLGLSVSYGIIDSYGGTIGHCGNEWGGATFFFELPVVDKSSTTSDGQPAVLLRSA